jgi:hypothetical protein
MTEQDTRTTIRAADHERLLARRRSERLVIERLLTTSGSTASAGAVVRTVLACSRELSEAGVDHGLPDVLHAMAMTRMTSLAWTA